MLCGWLREQISDVVVCGYISQVDNTVHVFLANEMMFNVDMLRPFVAYWILGHVKRSLVVPVDGCWWFHDDAKIFA